MSKFFGVSESWVMNGKNDELIRMTSDEIDMLASFRSMPPQDQETIRSLIEKLKKN